MKHYLIYLSLFVAFAGNAQKFPFEFKNEVYDEFIKTVTSDVNNLPSNFPILELKSSQYLMLKFDDLLNDERNLYYRVIHCDKDWNPSKLSEIEYLSGFNDERVRNYSYSINTRVPFLHYWLQIPNKNTALKVSGNYLLVIYEDRIEYPVLTRRFVVMENKVQVAIKGIFPGDVENIRFKQEMQVSINFENFKMRNPVNEITLLMLQNEDWLTTKQSQPSFFSGVNLKFNKLRTFDFWGLSEYREFDTRSLLRLGRHVQFIERNKYYTDVLLILDQPWRNKVYLNYFDFNGKFIIDNFERMKNRTFTDAIDDYTNSVQSDENLRESQRDSIVSSIKFSNTLIDQNYTAEERNLRSDYANVIFSLEDGLISEKDEVYVLGAFNNWRPAEEFRMKYDQQRNIYTTQVSLKQGYYNYHYGILKKDGTIDYHGMEGSWSDTENEYQAIVYYRGLGDIYDRIIGYGSYNTSSASIIR